MSIPSGPSDPTLGADLALTARVAKSAIRSSGRRYAFDDSLERTEAVAQTAIASTVRPAQAQTGKQPARQVSVKFQKKPVEVEEDWARFEEVDWESDTRARAPQATPAPAPKAPPAVADLIPAEVLLSVSLPSAPGGVIRELNARPKIELTNTKTAKAESEAAQARRDQRDRDAEAAHVARTRPFNDVKPREITPDRVHELLIRRQRELGGKE